MTYLKRGEFFTRLYAYLKNVYRFSKKKKKLKMTADDNTYVFYFNRFLDYLLAQYRGKNHQ